MSLDVSLTANRPCTVFNYNITHNLGGMAKAAGIYEALWHPEELRIAKAAELAPLLRTGLDALLADPAKFKALNPQNGWGDYDGLVTFVTKYLAACNENPDAEVSTWA